MKFGLEDTVIDRIQQVFEANPKVDEALLFGSRAKGNYRDDSDIDLALKGASLDHKDIIQIGVKLEELNLPYKIDLLNYHTINELALVEHIDRAGVVFYERWKEYKLSDLMYLIGGGTPKTTIPEYWDGDIPWLSVTDFNTGRKYCFDAGKKITDRGLKESSTKILKRGQLIISARGTVGVLSVIGKDMAFNQSCYGIDAKIELTSNDFLYYLLKNNIASFHSASYGAVFDTITKTTFDHISVLVPDKVQQNEIASTLSSLDDKIDLLHRQNKTLEDLAQTLFDQLFIKDDDGNLKTEKLGDVIRTTSGGTPRRDTPEYYRNGTIKWIKSKELQGSFIFDTEEHITSEAVKNSSAKMLPENSILIAMYGATVGEFGILAAQATCNQAICALIPNEKYPYTYLYSLVKCKKDYIISIAVGSAQQNISQVLIKELDVSGEHRLIEKFHVKVEPMFEKIKLNISQSQSLIKLRDSLLPKLMSREMRIDM